MNADITHETGRDHEAAKEEQPRSRLRGIDHCGLLFVLLSLTFGGFFAAITPSFWGFDEFEHFGRAYAIDHGQILPQHDPVRDIYGVGGVPSSAYDLRELAVHNFINPGEAPDPSVTDRDAFHRLEQRPLETPLRTALVANTSAYSPVAYGPSLLGLRIAELSDASVGTAITLMRLADVVAYTGLVWLGMYALRGHRLKWLVFVVALLPMAVYEAATITADAVTNATAILFGALFVKATFLRQPLPGWESALLVGSAVLLPVTKPSYVLLSLLLLLVPGARLALWRGTKYVATLVGMGMFGAWTALTAKVGPGQAVQLRPGDVVDAGSQLDYALSHPLELGRVLIRTFVYQENIYFGQFFGVFGHTWVPAPALAQLSWILAAVLAFGIAGWMYASRVQLTATAVIAALNVAAVFALLYLQFTPVGFHLIEGVQGRYFIPLVILGAAVALQLVPLRLRLASPRHVQGSKAAIVILVLIALASSAAKYEYVTWHG
ncbi:hypothetical protein FHU38_003176 [Saccharomonospora amisosensis]|uniref:Membrane protein (DUF2142) n=1 Tax=Saccharomonospora amisosensis TaxID=1128677 RepID=A0A7X5US12_9PSEU|nr:DUF2142 domain-containing protein [Saccharomonospora amisosensis]NIJ12832.1 hypothetical protein [Saccharomonospora amisosensis]